MATVQREVTRAGLGPEAQPYPHGTIPPFPHLSSEHVDDRTSWGYV